MREKHLPFIYGQIFTTSKLTDPLFNSPSKGSHHTIKDIRIVLPTPCNCLILQQLGETTFTCTTLSGDIKSPLTLSDNDSQHAVLQYRQFRFDCITVLIVLVNESPQKYRRDVGMPHYTTLSTWQTSHNYPFLS